MTFPSVYGARPLKRYLEKHITTELSKLIIQTKLSSHCHVTIDMDHNDQFQFHIEQLPRTNSNSPQKPAYNRAYRSKERRSNRTEECLGRRTYEGLDEEPMMDVDYDDEYEHQFTGYDQEKNPSSLKRMKQSPNAKK